jgi:Fe-S-cluster containining protein
MKLCSILPDFYHTFLPDFFEKEFPDETLAQCDNCSFQSNFDPKIKCCTRYPTLANYLVGAILSGSGKDCEHAKALIHSMIERKAGVTPLGIGPPKKIAMLHFQAPHPPIERQLEELICPFFYPAKGLCGIYNYRNSECATFFCKSVKAKTGENFWQTLNEYLKDMESLIAQFAAWRQNFSARVIRAMLAEHQRKEVPTEDFRLEVDDDNYQSMWEHFAGKEIQYFIQCYEVVNAIGKREFKRLGGFDLETKLEMVRTNRKLCTNPELPDYLMLNPELMIQRPKDGFVLLDEFEFSEDIYNFLKQFKGFTTTGELLWAIKKEQGVKINPSILEPYFHLGILVASDFQEQDLPSC